MNKQAVLDRIISHLHEQGAPGQQHNGCFYRTTDGRKSAIGCLIPDELYSDGLEDSDPGVLPQYILDAIDADSDDEIEFLASVESAHDLAARNSLHRDNNFWSEWTAELIHIASEQSLSLAIIGKLGQPQEPTTELRPPVQIARLGGPAITWRIR